MAQLVPLAYDYMHNMIGQYIKWLPKNVQKAIEDGGLQLALNVTFDATEKHIPSHFIETMQGMANSSGVDYLQIRNLAMLPELIKASCSIVGAWGDATAETDSELVQLRALDWDMNGPFQQFPVLLVYHPLEGDGHPFAVLSWAGLVGAITGYSSINTGISEKVWLSYDGIQNIFGYPFHFLLQDILQYDIDHDQALSRIASANRTCSVFMGIGDAANNMLKLVEYSFEQVHIFNPVNFPTYPNHDRFKDLVFVDKHVQPDSNPCMNNIMHEYYGQLGGENMARAVTAIEQTGDTHIGVYDFANSYMYISNAAPVDSSGKAVPAYDRPFIRMDMAALFNTTDGHAYATGGWRSD
jgi:hypothetical protein